MAVTGKSDQLDDEDAVPRVQSQHMHIIYKPFSYETVASESVIAVGNQIQLLRVLAGFEIVELFFAKQAIATGTTLTLKAGLTGVGSADQYNVAINGLVISAGNIYAPATGVVIFAPDTVDRILQLEVTVATAAVQVNGAKIRGYAKLMSLSLGS